LVTLEALHREHEQTRGGIGPLWWRFLYDIARATATRFPPQLLTSSLEWTPEALEDVFHDWMTDDVVPRDLVPRALIRCKTLPGLRSYLAKALENFCRNRLAKGEASRLFKRTKDVLRSDPTFLALGHQKSAAAQRWTLRDRPASEVSHKTPVELLAIAHQLTDDDLEVVWYGPESAKSSPVLRDPALRRFLSHLLVQADGVLDQWTIQRVIVERFGLAQPVLEELQNGHESTLTFSDPVHDVVAVEEAKLSVLARMGKAGADALRAFEECDGDWPAIAARVGATEDEVAEKLRGIWSMIYECVDGVEERREVWDALVESLSTSDEK
jgi:hypothetical protein